MRFLTGRSGILASTAILLLASTTRADFTLVFGDAAGNGFSETESSNGTLTFTGKGSLAGTSDPFTALTMTSFSGSLKLDGYSFNFTASAPPASDGGEVNLMLSAKNPSKQSAATAFTYSMTESLKFTTAPTTLSAALNTGTNTAGIKVTAQGSYANLDTKKLSLTGAFSSDSDSKKVPKGDTSGALGVSGDFKIPKAASTLGFTADGKVTGGKLVTTPEPAGVLACALGFPCMAAVVFWARRRADKAAVLV